MFENSNLQTIILTSRPEQAEAFYRNTLGLPLVGTSDGALVFRVGHGVLRVAPVPETAPTEHTVMGFGVTDIASAVEQLHSRGVALERFAGFPHDEHGILLTPDQSKVAWFRDPDGNLLSVVQFPAC